mgnify:CR=1 FL=1
MPLNRREFLFRGAGLATVSAMVPRFPILGTRYLEESVAAGDASIQVSWASTAGATGYDVYRDGALRNVRLHMNDALEVLRRVPDRRRLCPLRP